MVMSQIAEELHSRGYRYRSGRPFIEVKPKGQRFAVTNTIKMTVWGANKAMQPTLFQAYLTSALHPLVLRTGLPVLDKLFNRDGGLAKLLPGNFALECFAVAIKVRH